MENLMLRRIRSIDFILAWPPIRARTNNWTLAYRGFEVPEASKSRILLRKNLVGAKKKGTRDGDCVEIGRIGEGFAKYATQMVENLRFPGPGIIDCHLKSQGIQVRTHLPTEIQKISWLEDGGMNRKRSASQDSS